ncbi:hypothetical protein T03_15863, partial [Trichinella britovi]
LILGPDLLNLVQDDRIKPIFYQINSSPATLNDQVMKHLISEEGIHYYSDKADRNKQAVLYCYYVQHEMADKQEMYPLQLHKRSFYFVDFISRKNPCLEHVALFENLWLTLCEVFSR